MTQTLSETIESAPFGIEHQNMEGFRYIFEHAAAGMATAQLDGGLMQVNSAFCQYLGYTQTELLRLSVYDITHPVDLDRTKEIFSAGVEGQSSGNHYSKRYMAKDGSVVWGLTTLVWVRDCSDKPVYCVALIQDTTAAKKSEQALRQSETLYRSLVENVDLGINLIGKDRRILKVNSASGRMFSKSAESFVGQECFREFEKRDEICPHCPGSRSLATGEPSVVITEGVRGDGSRFAVRVQTFAVPEVDQPAGTFIEVVEDITERRRYEAHLEHLATHDDLTGLANRALLLDRLEQSLHYADRSKRLVAVLLLDLDRFQIINDSLGHAFGDQILCAVAKRLQHNVREADTVARLGGDEFVLLLAEVAEPEDVGLIATKILRHLAEPMFIAGREITMTACLGVSLFPRDSGDAATLIRHAEIAMYRAKRSDRGTFAFFSPEMNQRILETLELESALRQALELEQFCLHYQPKINLVSGHIVGCEALVRWHHPQRGMISPADFIPLAEETGLIVPLGTWVLKEACRQAKTWQDEELSGLSVAVNLSARQFRKGDLPQIVKDILKETGLDPKLLELELTESMVMDDPVGAERTMHILKDLGVGLSLDDFGTGYSSLNYLRRFPVGCLKIDRSFIRDVATDPSGASVVTSVIDIAHNLGLTAVAEGVETREQLAFLTRCGCDTLQGFLFSKPLPDHEFTALMAKGRKLSLD